MSRRASVQELTMLAEDDRVQPSRQSTDEDTEEQIPFQIHPRVFSALGADLVRNDVVAVMELVKNSYDALATTVDVQFGVSDEHGKYLDVVDNGTGIERDTLENVWCIVATPHRHDHPLSKKGTRTRRVAGEKGLGRLSAARLGRQLHMLTKAASEPCWLVKVNWPRLAESPALGNCFATCSVFEGDLPFNSSGTRVRVFELTADWNEEQIHDLKDNLSRLVSPFSEVDDFTLRFSSWDSSDSRTVVAISAPDFLNKPPYAIRGHVTQTGHIKARYEFNPISEGKRRSAPRTLKWSDILEGSDIGAKLSPKKPGCGAFDFEIRAWDIGQDDTQQIADLYEIQKASIRKAIRTHKGISVYRDGILVLPKSDDARDWLGLDLRRVSRVGTRLSTSQIVGYVSITANGNEAIDDTSDREGLAANTAVFEFQEIILAAVCALEAERDSDRLKPGKQVKLQELLDGVSADELVEEVTILAEEGAAARETVNRVRAFGIRLQKVRDGLKTRFIYYSRLATVGSIAQMLVHEIRNRTTAIGRVLRSARSIGDESSDSDFQEQLALAESSVQTLEHLADTFSPLASRSFRRGRRDAYLEASIARCLELLNNEIKNSGTKIVLPGRGQTRVAVDPGELDAVILNLLLNAFYWIPKSRRRPELRISRKKMPGGKRVKITISDSGSGIDRDHAEKVFLPGVTRKPGGIGMGLTVAAELVSEYHGQIALVRPGELRGATFEFDLPLKA